MNKMTEMEKVFDKARNAMGEPVRRLVDLFSKFAEAMMQDPAIKKKIEARRKYRKRVANRQKLHRNQKR